MDKTIIGNETVLKPIHTNQKSFYNKAITRTDISPYGIYHSLFSYGTFIIEIKEHKDGTKHINAITDNPHHFTLTTLKHLNEFIQQHGMGKKIKPEWLEVQASQFNYAY